MRVLGFVPIYYGVEYLRECLLSISDQCEKVVVSYTPQPSHGHGTNVECPDSNSNIFDIASNVLSDKLIWHEGVYNAENEHRQSVHYYSAGYDLVLSIDADEVYEPTELRSALEYAYSGQARRYGLKGYLNFWRSFKHVCTDGFRPIRIENMNRQNQDQDLECPLTVYHFSTAQSSRIMNFKYGVFGHADEVRKNWLQDIYYGWKTGQTDVHCVAFGIWNPEPFNKNRMPDILKQHPNFNKEVIE